MSIEMLSDPDGEVRLRAIRVLGRTGDKSVLPALEQAALSDTYSRIADGGMPDYYELEYNRDAAQSAMVDLYLRWGISDEEVAQLIAELGAPRGWPSRSWLCGAILRDLRERVLADLEAALRHPNQQVRTGVASVLYSMRDLAWRILEGARTHEDGEVRAIALQAGLSTEAHIVILPRLAEALQDPHPLVRRTVLEHCYRASLMNIPEQDAPAWLQQVIGFFERSLGDADEGVRLAALEGIARQRALPGPGAGLRWSQLIQQHKYQPQPALLEPFLDDPNPMIRLTALKSWPINSVESRERAQRLLENDSEARVSLAAARQLQSYGYLDRLRILQHDPRPELRLFAASNLFRNKLYAYIYLATLISYAELLLYEKDAKIKQQVIRYLEKVVPSSVPHREPEEVSRLHRLATALQLLQEDPDIGEQVTQLYRQTLVMWEERYIGLLTFPQNTEILRELSLCGDARALPLLERIVKEDIIETQWDDNGAGGAPHYWDVPLKPAAEEAIRAIRQRLTPPDPV